MLVSTYDPTSEATCPCCKKVVKCYNFGGITWGFDPYLDFIHEECGTKWRWHMHTGEVESPIPQPMGLRQMMGEENWHQMIWREHLQSHAEEMFEVLEAMATTEGIHGQLDEVEKAQELVARIKKLGEVKKRE